MFYVFMNAASLSYCCLRRFCTTVPFNSLAGSHRFSSGSSATEKSSLPTFLAPKPGARTGLGDPIMDSPYFWHVDGKRIVFRDNDLIPGKGLKCETYDPDNGDPASFIRIMLDPAVQKIFHDKALQTTSEVQTLFGLIETFAERVKEGNPRAPLVFKNSEGDAIGFAWLEDPHMKLSHVAAGYTCIDPKYYHRGYGSVISAFLIEVYAKELRRLGEMTDCRFKFYFNDFYGQLNASHADDGVLRELYATMRLSNTAAIKSIDAHGLAKPCFKSFKNPEGKMVKPTQTLDSGGKDRAFISGEDTGKTGGRYCFSSDIPQVDGPPGPLDKEILLRLLKPTRPPNFDSEDSAAAVLLKIQELLEAEEKGGKKKYT